MLRIFIDLLIDNRLIVKYFSWINKLIPVFGHLLKLSIVSVWMRDKFPHVVS